jgi:serine/threonine protein kinase
VDDLTGQTIRGYEIRENIGAGGYGAVYRAYQPAVSREVAIKVILPEHASKPDFAQRFEQEARLVAQLEHPHIVPLYDYWRDNDGAFLVMRWLRGGSLRAVLDRQGALSLVQTARLLDQVAEALAAAHEAGVVHRDLKPDNILLDERGNAYLGDFGIAKQLDSKLQITDPDSMVGSLAYLSPEQIKGEPVTPQTDIYSMGVVLYEMLTGEHPFANAKLLMVNKHLQEPLPPLHQKRADLPSALDDSLWKATQKAPTERYATVLALADDFREAANLMSGHLPLPLSSLEAARSPLPAKERKISATTEQRNRYHMLQNVRSFWVAGVLENSLHGAALIDLGMRQESGVVGHPWDTLVRMSGSPDQTLPSGTPILRIFDQLNGKLLILGDPGSGKTTTLLELTRDLLDRAESDEAHPIPVVFNLSSWSESRKPLTEWLVDELTSKYQVPRKVAQAWVKSDDLMLLLDGLDEVDAPQREACVQAVNIYREEHGFVDVVVCSRSADYEALTNKLKLNGAIVLQPLSEAQVDTYLGSFGPEMATVRGMLEEDETLRELSQSPLMLSILAFAYRGVSAEQLPRLDTLEARRAHLFEVYLQRMFERRVGEKAFTQEQTVHYLSWLAQKMQEHTQTVFHIENLQPTWLSDERRQRYYSSVRVIDVPARVVLAAMPAFILAEPALNIAGWLIGALYGLAMGLSGWLGTGGHPQRLSNQLIVGAFTGFVWGLSVGVRYGLVRGIVFGLGTTVFGALVSVLASVLLGNVSLELDRITPVEALRFSYRKMDPRLGIIGLVAGAVGVVPFRLVFAPGSLPLAQFVTGMIGGGLVNGLGVLLTSGLTASEMEIRTRPNQGTWSSLGNGGRIWLGFSAILILFGLLGIAPVSSLAAGLAIGIILSLSLGYSIGLNYGGSTVIRHIALRRILYRDGAIPSNYARFLDYAASLIFLRKVGGGYIFVHRLLLEYFAGIKNVE